MDLNEARKQIRAVDLKMRDLFLQRMEAVRMIADWKKERGIPIEDKEQELRILSELGAGVKDEELRSFYLCFVQDVIDVSKQWQHHLLDDL